MSKPPHLNEREANILRAIRRMMAASAMATTSELNSLLAKNLTEQAAPTAAYEPRLTAIGIRALDGFDEGK